MEITSHGPHQFALRRRSVKVFEGAMKVLTMRAPSESGADSGVAAGGDIGGSGAAAMFWPPVRCETNSSRDAAATQAGDAERDWMAPAERGRPHIKFLDRY